MWDDADLPPEHEKEAAQRKRLWVLVALVGAAAVLLAVGGGVFALRREQQVQMRELEMVRADAEMRHQMVAVQERARLEALHDAELRLKAEQTRQGIRRNLALAAALRQQSKFEQAEAALAQAVELAKDAPDLIPEIELARGDLAEAIEQKAERDARVAPPPREVKR